MIRLGRFAQDRIPIAQTRNRPSCGYRESRRTDILETFVDRGQLRNLAQPTVLPGGKRVPGLKLDNPRQLALMHALVRFAHIAAGNTFTTAELYPHVLGRSANVRRPIQFSVASVRPFETESQGAGRETSSVPPLSPLLTRVLHLSCVSQTLRTHLRTAHCRLTSTPVGALFSSNRFLPIIYRTDSKLKANKRTQLDRLYQKVLDDLEELVDAIGLKAA